MNWNWCAILKRSAVAQTEARLDTHHLSGLLLSADSSSSLMCLFPGGVHVGGVWWPGRKGPARPEHRTSPGNPPGPGGTDKPQVSKRSGVPFRLFPHPRLRQCSSMEYGSGSLSWISQTLLRKVFNLASAYFRPRHEDKAWLHQLLHWSGSTEIHSGAVTSIKHSEMKQSQSCVRTIAWCVWINTKCSTSCFRNVFQTLQPHFWVLGAGSFDPF